jgi:hypothetical protein
VHLDNNTRLRVTQDRDFDSDIRILHSDFSYLQNVSKRASQLWMLIYIYSEDMQSVLKRHNVAKHTEFYLG